MALPYNFLLVCSVFLFISSATIAQTSFRPKALLLPVSKDAATLQYVTHINQRTPLVPVKLTVHLGGETLWVDCEKGFVSASFKPARCGSAQCSLATADACSGLNVCGQAVDNPIIRTATHGDIGQDVVSLQSTDGSNPGKVVKVPNFIFTCGATLLVRGLANGVTGMAGLGRSKIALPTQLAAAFSFKRKFALCLSSSTTSDENGIIIFGDGPYVIRPGFDLSKSLTYTPLLINPVSTASAFSLGDKSFEYFIGVKSVNVNGKSIPLNKTLLSIDSNGIGGTKISTVDPYTVLETSIYNAVVSAFVNGIADSQKSIFGCTSQNVKFSVTGANSMVSVSDNVLCLGFVDGGVNPRTSIVVGGYQLENNLLQFDLASSRLGFSPSLIVEYRTNCGNFNFTSN
ncbi:hypothetical protein Dsin_029527 [Dipteronia sinensis]|uniref:Peptidase A1 domain-containing protein n=1 Tax=Dipteronia sinensis TaxID=43782 RepID=A0AAD9ZU92_9ROSI|nr:hypothetical protein Dsin_029527 [Dipteronia sinensis]